MKRKWYWLLLIAGTLLGLVFFISLQPNQSEIESKATQIRLGMSRADVVTILGNDYGESKREPAWTVLTWSADSSFLRDEVFVGIAFNEKEEVVGVVQNKAEPSFLHKLKAKLGL